MTRMDRSRPTWKGPGEAPLLRALVKQGLDAPDRSYRLFLDSERETEPDFAWPPIKLAVYVDGEVHADYEQLYKDHVKRNGLGLQGWTVLAYTNARVFEKAVVCAKEISQLWVERCTALFDLVDRLDYDELLFEMAWGRLPRDSAFQQGIGFTRLLADVLQVPPTLP